MDRSLAISYLILLTVITLIAGTAALIIITDRGPDVSDIPYLGQTQTINFEVEKPENYTKQKEFKLVNSATNCKEKTSLEGEGLSTYNTRNYRFSVNKDNLEEFQLVKFCRKRGEATEVSQTIQITDNENVTQISNYENPETDISFYLYNEQNRLFRQLDLKLELGRVTLVTES